MPMKNRSFILCDQTLLVSPTAFVAYKRCAIVGDATPALSWSLSSAGTYAYICPSAMHVVVRF
eukprot:COSAG02_NODE_42482_length_384_cov_0.726316_1_plen_62_part_01